MTDQILVGELIVHGGDTNQYTKEMENEYIERYREIVDKINKVLNKINNKWDAYHTGPMEVDSWTWDVYGQFLSAYERGVCVKDNLKHKDSRIFMDCIPKEGEPKIVGIIDRNPDVYYELVNHMVKLSDLLNK